MPLTGKDKIEKTHPGVAKVNKWILKQYDEGRVTAISDDEMEHLVRRYMPEIFVSEFELLKKRAYDMAAHLIEQYIEDPAIKSMDPGEAGRDPEDHRRGVSLHPVCLRRQQPRV